jgi:hypothetical protein
MTPKTELFSVSGHHRNRNLLRYPPESRYSPKAVTGKWLFRNELATKPKNEIRTTQQITDHKMCHELRLMRLRPHT